MPLATCDDCGADCRAAYPDCLCAGCKEQRRQAARKEAGLGRVPEHDPSWKPCRRDQLEQDLLWDTLALDLADTMSEEEWDKKCEKRTGWCTGYSRGLSGCNAR